eukprot:COSAG02_NODE_16132_length_1110_cov_2.329377_1_plen_96_part_00
MCCGANLSVFVGQIVWQRFERELARQKQQQQMMTAMPMQQRHEQLETIETIQRKEQVLEQALRGGDGGMPFHVFACPGGARSRVTLSHVEHHEEY